MGRNFFIIVLVFCMILFFSVTLNQDAMMTSENLKMDYNEAIDNAAIDAAQALLLPDSNDSYEALSYGDDSNFEKLDLNLKEGLNRFYRSLYFNLGIQNNASEQQALLNKIPIMIAAGYDGYYVHTWQETKVNGKLQVTNNWSSKKKYSVYDTKDNIKISFTLDDFVYYEDLSTGKQYEGNRQTFASKYPNYFSDANFSTVRSQVINQLIQDDLDNYTYSNNAIAKKYGWQLQFNTPLWGNRAITTISFIAFIQGKLIPGTQYYDTYGFGTAKIIKKQKIYGYIKNGVKLYSTQPMGSEINIFDSAQDAAKSGYSPDPKSQ